MKSQCFSRGKESNEPTLIFAFIGHISMVYTFWNLHRDPKTTVLVSNSALTFLCWNHGFSKWFICKYAAAVFSAYVDTVDSRFLELSRGWQNCSRYRKFKIPSIRDIESQL